MKQFLTFLIVLVFVHTIDAQNLAGYYKDEGYFFHPVSTRNISLTKYLVQIGPNSYQVDLGDLGTESYKFQFDIDENNKLVNWSAAGSTPPEPSSNFMSMDDPGNFYNDVPPGNTGSPAPGFATYVQTTYSNTYDPATKTFYFHYGYAVGSTSQNGFTRQIYEKLTLIRTPEVLSITPMTGSSLTKIAIRGKNFSGIQPDHGISFGNVNSDSAVVVSDTIINAWVGSGATGNVVLSNDYYSGSFPDFTYIPVPTSTNTGGWQYLGNPGFSTGKGYSVNAVINKNNRPYVVFVDSSDGKAKVMKYENNNWVNAGDLLSGGKCSNTKIAIDSAGNPIVAYLDSTTESLIKVKKFDGSNWIDLNIPRPRFSVGFFSFAADKLNNIYVPISGYNDSTVNMFVYNDTTWTITPEIAAMSYPYADFNITIDKNNTPYFLFKDNINSIGGQMSVKKLAGKSWAYVGKPGFATGIKGAYYPTVKIDTLGRPLVVFQENNGFQRLAAYKFDGNNWILQNENLFSKSRSHFVSLSIDNNNKSFVAFIDSSYNGRGTILTFNAAAGKWESSGPRGFIPCLSLENNALLTDNANSTLIAFSDISHNGRLSVMKLATDFIWTGAVNTAWENPLNWKNGMVPTSSANVFINAGGIVKLSSNTTINSITIHPGASLTILQDYALTITGP